MGLNEVNRFDSSKNIFNHPENAQFKKMEPF